MEPGSLSASPIPVILARVMLSGLRRFANKVRASTQGPGFIGHVFRCCVTDDTAIVCIVSITRERIKVIELAITLPMVH